MPSKSKAQQRFFGLVRSVQKGKTMPSKVGKKVRDAARNMSVSDVCDFASTKSKKLPEKVNEYHLRRIIQESVLESLHILFEGASAKLYHYIDALHLLHLLRTNSFSPQEAETFFNTNTGQCDYINGQGQRFMSFTRNKNFHEGYPVVAYGEFGTNGDDGIVCRVELDGNALNRFCNFKDKHGKQRNFNVKPIDWEYYDFGNGSGDPSTFADNTHGIFAHNGKEHMMQSDDYTVFGWDSEYGTILKDKYAHPMSQAEDRLTTTAVSIPNASKYITRIDIYFDVTMTNYAEEDVMNAVWDIEEACDRLNIPLCIYHNLRDFSLQNDRHR